MELVQTIAGLGGSSGVTAVILIIMLHKFGVLDKLLSKNNDQTQSCIAKMSTQIDTLVSDVAEVKENVKGVADYQREMNGRVYVHDTRLAVLESKK